MAQRIARKNPQKPEAGLIDDDGGGEGNNQAATFELSIPVEVSSIIASSSFLFSFVLFVGEKL